MLPVTVPLETYGLDVGRSLTTIFTETLPTPLALILAVVADSPVVPVMVVLPLSKVAGPEISRV